MDEVASLGADILAGWAGSDAGLSLMPERWISIRCPHFRQVALLTSFRSFSSGILYVAPQLSQTTLICFTTSQVCMRRVMDHHGQSSAPSEVPFHRRAVNNRANADQ